MSQDSSKTLPPQQQDVQPGGEGEMRPAPKADAEDYVGSGKLKGQVAIITGGDSGIGRSVAICFAKEGANVVISYLNEHEDARHTLRKVEEQGVQCLALAGDIADDGFLQILVNSTLERFGRIDILVNNAAEQHPKEKIEDVTSAQLEQTFRTNFFSMFNLTRMVVPHMKPGSTIINTTSVTAYRGNPQLLDYSATKGAIVAFTRSLSKQLVKRGIRVNAVAPGPVWTPLIPSTFDAQHVETFGSNVPMGRPGQPDEISPSYVFLASKDSSYISGQVLHPNGGDVVNG